MHHRVYRYLNNTQVPDRDRASSGYTGHEFVVQSKRRDISYMVYNTVEDFYTYYTSLHPSQRTFNEIIYEGYQKFRLDIDHKIPVRELEGIMYFVHTLLKILTGKRRKILVYDIQTSYHIIVPDVALESSGCCHMLANLVMDGVSITYPHLVSFIDLGVYKAPQMFRLEASTKYLQQRWKYLKDHTQLTELSTFKLGLIGYTQGCYKLDTDVLVNYALRSGIYKMGDHGSSIGEISNIWSISHNLIRTFRVRETIGNMVILDRKYPSYCTVCKRIHEHENAYMVNGRLYCRRSNSRH